MGFKSNAGISCEEYADFHVDRKMEHELFGNQTVGQRIKFERHYVGRLSIAARADGIRRLDIDDLAGGRVSVELPDDCGNEASVWLINARIKSFVHGHDHKTIPASLPDDYFTRHNVFEDGIVAPAFLEIRYHKGQPSHAFAQSQSQFVGKEYHTPAHSLLLFDGRPAELELITSMLYNNTGEVPPDLVLSATDGMPEVSEPTYPLLGTLVDNLARFPLASRSTSYHSIVELFTKTPTPRAPSFYRDAVIAELYKELALPNVNFQLQQSMFLARLASGCYVVPSDVTHLFSKLRNNVTPSSNTPFVKQAGGYPDAWVNTTTEFIQMGLSANVRAILLSELYPYGTLDIYQAAVPNVGCLGVFINLQAESWMHALSFAALSCTFPKYVPFKREFSTINEALQMLRELPDGYNIAAESSLRDMYARYSWGCVIA